MYELKNDRFYAISEEYSDCCIDYCLLADDKEYEGEKSHRKAIEFALKIFDSDEPEWHYDIQKAAAREITADELLKTPSKPWKYSEKQTDGSIVTAFDDTVKGEGLPYWYAFLEPPCQNGYTAEDFKRINSVLFPDKKSLTVFEWSTDWSDYFDEGHEWWGAACWSVYDKNLNRYVVIMASATD
jgi:hypothetical protein